MQKIINIAKLNLVLKAIQVLSNSYYIGLISRKFNPIEFGEMMLLVSLQTFTLNLDFGLGQSLRNKAVELKSKFNDLSSISKYMSSVFLFLILSSILLFAVFFNPFLSVQDLIYRNAVKQPNIYSLSLLKIYLISQIVIIPLNALLFIFYSFHKVIEKSFFEMLSPLLIAVILSLWNFRLDITGLIVFIAPFFVNFAGLTYLITSQKIEFNLFNAKLNYIQDLWGNSRFFWFLSIASSIFFGTDMLLISYKFDQAVSGEYAIMQRPVIVVLGLHLLILLPLWSYYTELFHAYKIYEARKLLRQTLIYTVFLFFVGSLIYIFFYQSILSIWFGKTILSINTIILICIWAFLYSILNCLSVFLNGIGDIKFQTIVLFACAVLNIPLSIYLMDKFKTNGTIISSIILLLFPILSNLIIIRKYNAKH
jgi:O-antigen/teichoic acid export membrane protein